MSFRIAAGCRYGGRRLEWVTAGQSWTARLVLAVVLLTGKVLNKASDPFIEHYSRSTP